MQVRRPVPGSQQYFLNYILTSWTLKEEWPGHHTWLPLLPEHLPKTMIFVTNILSTFARSQFASLSKIHPLTHIHLIHSTSIGKLLLSTQESCFHTTLVLQVEQLRSLKIQGDSTLLDVILLRSLLYVLYVCIYYYDHYGEGWAKGMELSHKWRWAGSFDMTGNPGKSGQRMSGSRGGDV